MKPVNWVQKALATVFFLGYFPWMPGTIGSAVVIAGLWHMHYHLHFAGTPRLWWFAIVVFSAFAITIASRTKEVFRHEDPKEVIIDECAGQLVTFFLVPISLGTLLLGFALFRFFDIIKPYPIYKMEELEGGLGITMDDIIAGVFANVSLSAILWVYGIVKAALA